MDIIMFIISLVSMIATVISCTVAVKAKNEVKRLSLKIQAGEVIGSKVNGDISLNNNGNNSGVMAGVVTGGDKK
jgi:hypothetical protein